MRDLGRWLRRGTFAAIAIVIHAAPILHGSTAAVAAATNESVAELVQRMDALWLRRDAHGTMADTVTLGTLALAVDPNSYDVKWRMARAYFWVAYSQPARVAKKALAAKAVEWAAQALRAQPDRVEGNYYYAVSLGEYASTVGIMQAIVDGVAGKVESSAERARAIDPDYENGAPGTVLGRFFFLLPWPKKDLDKSREYLEEVVSRHPRALLARVYLAETYHELDKDEKARQQLDYVLATDPLPGSELDRPAPKPLAQAARREWFSDR
jgi:hypothetical protein